MTTPAYHTVLDVELVSVGMNWPAASGDRTITPEDCADAVRAANDDPLILDPRVKLGHSDPRFNSSEELLAMHDPTWDGEPAFGRATNLRLAEDGMVVVGDLEGVPDWLTAIDPDSGVRVLAAAFPSRSIEPIFNWTTAGQRFYRMVIAAVALLGENWPACQDIEDLELYVTEGPAALAARREEQETAALAAGGTMPPQTAALSTSIDLVQYLFNWDWAMQEHPDGVDRWMWWARDIRLDPVSLNGGSNAMRGEVIASDGQGGTWSVPFTVTADDMIEYAAPTRVREDYAPANEPEAVAAFGLNQPVKGDSRAAFTARATAARGVLQTRFTATTTTETVPPPAATTPEEEPTVATNDETVTDAVLIRRGLDLADDATDDEVQAARDALASDGGSPEPETPETPEAEVETPEGGPVMVDAAQLAELRAGAQAGIAAQAELAKRDGNAARDTYLSAKVADGTIHPSNRGAYELLWETAGADKAREQIDAMEPGLVPVLQRGEQAALSASTPSLPEDGSVPEGLSLLTPAERAPRKS